MADNNELYLGIYDIEKISRGKYDIYKIYEDYQAAMYLVCGEERAVLIDSAYGLRDLGEIIRTLTALPVTIINTHGHIDHVLGNHFFDRAYMHPADMPLYQEIVDGYADLLAMPWVKETYGEYIENLDPSAVRFPAAEEIKEGDVIDLGGKKLEVIEIPGHTPGSIMLLDRDEKLLFSGDSMIEHLWMFLEESLPPDTYLASLRRAVKIMKDAGTERIYNGHYCYKPLTIADAETILEGVEKVVSGAAKGEPFKNNVGSGIEYKFGEYSVLCCDETELPA